MVNKKKFMYFESVFIKPKNFYINIYNINLSKKFMKREFYGNFYHI